MFIKREMEKGLNFAMELGVKISLNFAWATSLMLLSCLGRIKGVRRIAIASCKKEWADCCGGNQNNEHIIALESNRPTKELKKKLKLLLDPEFINNVWCSKWSSVLARNIFWVVQERKEWSIMDTLQVDQLFAIEIMGTALVAILKGKENKN